MNLLTELKPYEDGKWPIGELIDSGTERVKALIEIVVQPKCNLDEEQKYQVLLAALEKLDEIEEAIFNICGMPRAIPAAKKI